MTLDCRRCASPAELSAKLRLKRAALQADFGVCFRPFFAWLFEMGRQITAMNTGEHGCSVEAQQGCRCCS